MDTQTKVRQLEAMAQAIADSLFTLASKKPAYIEAVFHENVTVALKSLAAAAENIESEIFLSRGPLYECCGALAIAVLDSGEEIPGWHRPGCKGEVKS